MVYNVQIVVVD